MCKKIINKIRANKIIRKNPLLKESIKAYKILDNSCVDSVITKRPNGELNFSPVSFIEELLKSVVFYEVTTAFHDWITPDGRDYFGEILSKLDEIEDSIAELTKITQLQNYQSIIRDRRNQITSISTVTSDCFKAYCDYTLEHKSDKEACQAELKRVVEDWSTRICNGTNVYYEVENLLKMSITEEAISGKNFPQIYAELAYYSCPWEANGYNFRNLLKDEELNILLSNIFFALTYYSLKEGDKEAEYHRQDIINLTEKYLEIYNNTPVIINENPVCQIPGAELTFNGEWVAQDWVSRLQAAKDNKWDLCWKSERAKIYYQEDQGHYITYEELSKIWSFYGGQKNLVDCLCESRFIDSGGFLHSCFHSIVYGNYFIFQNDLSIPSKDRVDAGLVKLDSNLLPNNYQVIKNCKITAVPAPMDPNPSKFVQEVGESAISNGVTGYYVILKRGR